MSRKKPARDAPRSPLSRSLSSGLGLAALLPLGVVTVVSGFTQGSFSVVAFGFMVLLVAAGIIAALIWMPASDDFDTEEDGDAIEDADLDLEFEDGGFDSE